MAIFLNKQNYILAPSIITPIYILMDLWRLWAHLCVRGWLSVNVQQCNFLHAHNLWDKTLAKGMWIRRFDVAGVWLVPDRRPVGWRKVCRAARRTRRGRSLGTPWGRRLPPVVGSSWRDLCGRERRTGESMFPNMQGGSVWVVRKSIKRLLGQE